MRWNEYLRDVANRKEPVEGLQGERPLSKGEQAALLLVFPTQYEILTFSQAGAPPIFRNRKTLATQFQSIYNKFTIEPATPQELAKRLRIGFDKLPKEDSQPGQSQADWIDRSPQPEPPKPIDRYSKNEIQATELKIVVHGCSIEQVGKQLVYEQLQRLIPNHPIEIVSITRGSVIIVVNSSAAGIQELYRQHQDRTFDRILGFPIAKLEILTDCVPEPPQQRLFGGIPDVPPQWVGRDELLDELHRELVAKKKVIAIVGQGGMGKTSLAAKVIESVGVDIDAKALTQACLYDRVLFFTVENTDGFDTVTAELLKMVEPGVAASQAPRETIDQIIAGLTKYRCLVVLDNLESLLQPQEVGRAIDIEVDNLLNALVVCGHRSQIIITSREFPQGLKDRRGDGVDIKLVKKVEIPKISMPDSIELLRQLGLTDTEEDLAWIAQRVDGNTLILTLLADYGKGQPGLLREEEPDIVCDKADGVIMAQFERQSAAEQELLRRMCVLRISMNAKHLATLRSIKSDADVVTATQVQVKETTSFLLWLKGCGLAESSYDAAVCQNFYALHRLVREVLFSKFEADLRDLYLYAARMYASFDRPKDENGKLDFRSFEDMRFVLEELYFYWLAEYDRQKLMETFLSILPKLNQWCYWDLAEEWLNKFLEDETLLKDPAMRATAWGYLGDIADRRGDNKAENLRNQALKVHTELNNRRGMANQWVGLGHIARKQGEYDKAKALYKQALEVWLQLNNRRGMATCWSGLGHIAIHRGEYNKAETLYNKALEVLTELDDRREMATIWVCLGGIAFRLSDGNKAEAFYNEALKVHIEFNDRENMATDWGNLGSVALAQGDDDKAETLYKQALKMNTQLDNRAGMATCWVCLGNVAGKRDHYDKATAFHNQALELMTQLNDRAGMATSWVTLAVNELCRGNFSTAATWLKKALTAREEFQYQHFDRMAALSWLLALWYRVEDDDQAAQEYYSISHALYTKLGAQRELERIERGWFGG
jgi:tetratricopeptide (TPR) repeat protein